MADKLPALRPEAIVKALERLGFQVRRQTGSHVILARPGLRRPIVIPMHRSELPRGTIADIIRQAGISAEEFLRNM